jgi:hypothetical protein
MTLGALYPGLKNTAVSILNANGVTGCQKESPPTRLIEVGPPKSACKSTYARLISGCDAIGKYVNLSHCWGSQPVCQSTKQSISDFGTEIPWDCLSKTFQDVIEITRALGIPYLWIDSLCIVQDDPTVFIHTSSMMHFKSNIVHVQRTGSGSPLLWEISMFLLS